MKNLLAVVFLLGLISCGIDNEVHDPNESELPPYTPVALVNPEQEDVFLEPAPQPVDILLVVDKSCSMLDDTTALNLGFVSFINYVTEHNLDYHIGLITTSNNEAVGAGKLVEFMNYSFITPQTPDPIMILSGMNIAAASQGEIEAGIDALSAAMGPRLRRGENTDFFRHGVPLQIVTITDEEDQSHFWTPKSLVLRLFHWMADHQNTVYYSAILTLPESWETCDYAVYSETIGYKYLEVVERVNGMAIDICQNDWSIALEAMAEYATPDPIPEYMLKEHPLLDEEHTIKVLVERDPVTLSFENEGDWTYDPDRNSVWIHTTSDGEAYEHQENDRVKISYTVDMY